MLEVNVLARDFYPDYSAVANKLTDLAEDLALNGVEVTVFTGEPFYYFKGNVTDKNIPNLEIRRVWCTTYSKDKLLLRVINELSFSVSVLLAVSARRERLNIIPTLPFTLQLAALLLKKIRKQDYILLNYEMIPELLYSSDILPQRSLLFKLLSKLSVSVLNNAKRVVAVNEKMKGRIYEKSNAVTLVIPNWADPDKVYPLKKKENRLLTELGLTDSFVVSYSGNFGRYMDFKTVLDSARILKEVYFLFVGNGAQKNKIKAGGNIYYSNYLPHERLNESINSGDVSLVLTNSRNKDYVMPSKILENMAAAKPIIAITDSDTGTAELVEKAKCGFVVSPGDTEGLVYAIKKLKDNKEEIKTLGKNGREYLLKKFTRKKMTREYYNLIKNIIQNTSGEVTSKIFLPIPQKEHHPDETRRMSKNAKKKTQ